MFSCTEPGVPPSEGLGLCGISLDLESEFDPIELEGVGVAAGGGRNKAVLGEGETVNG